MQKASLYKLFKSCFSPKNFKSFKNTKGINLRHLLLRAQPKSFKNTKGLSLIEMLVVVGILAFIMSIVARNVNQGRKKSQVNQAKILIGLIEQAMEEFSLDCGYYPETLDDLISAPSDCEQWGPDPYLKNGKIPQDPWKQDFKYEYDQNNERYVITSYGADRKPGGSGRFNKDISSDED